MKPKIITKGAFIIAGVAGSGDETAKAWEALTKINKLNPLANKISEEGYEVRLYPPGGPGKVQVGLSVSDPHVPAEYKVIALPAAAYAEFEMYPVKGYESSNAMMNQWLAENDGIYEQALLDGVPYAIEVYDKRYKGEKDPASVVDILLPISEIKRGK